MKNFLYLEYPEIFNQIAKSSLDDESLDLYKLTSGSSSKKLFWVCEINEDHIWQTTVHKRTSEKTGCPYCSGLKVAKDKSLAILYPDLAKEWHPNLNKNLTPFDVSVGSDKKLFWVCKINEEHIWQASVKHRTRERTGCPYCSGSKVTSETSLATLHPEISKEWHPELNKNITPFDVSPGSSKKIYWQCLKDESHFWISVVSTRTGKNAGNCPFCINQRLSNTNSIAFLYPEIAKDWHPTLNGDLTPHDVIGGSNRKIYWLCGKSTEHVWVTSAFNRTKSGTGCPYCSNRKLCSDNSLQAVRPDLAKEWDYEGNYPLTPNDVLYGAKKSVHWICLKSPYHKWTAFLDNRVTRRSRGCPCCAGLKVSVDNSLAFGYPLIAAGWHPTLNGDLTPEGIASGSGKRVYWQCLNNVEHVWQAAIGTRVQQNQWCPSCKTPKIQKEICEVLSSLHGEDWKDSKIKLNRIGFTKGIAQIDMLLLTEHRKVVVEYDGLYWHRDISVKDINTTNALMDAGYLVIRLRECTNRQTLPFLAIDDKRLKQIQFNYNEKDTPGYMDTVCQNIYAFIENFYAKV